MVPSTASLPASQAKVAPSRRGNSTTTTTNSATAPSTGSNTINNKNNNSAALTLGGGSSSNTATASSTATCASSTTTTASRRSRSSVCWTHPDHHNNNNSNSSNNNNTTTTTTNTTSTTNNNINYITNDPTNNTKDSNKLTVTAATTTSSSSSTRGNPNHHHSTMMMMGGTNISSSSANSNGTSTSSRHYHRHSRPYHHRHHHIQDIMQQQHHHDDDMESDVEDDDYDDYDDEEEEEEEHNIRLCLHCKSEKTNKSDIQVRCDECTSYICDDCHWCHEYQANHEIRVCDRCDGFYCRHCDEMDQCDDCHEVVCTSCSTLLSCKFCGGGLCEDCATACGRCGIVLCSRDSKFAVECDTCRLSYCLVCLASGSKDACVRCGSRPSKRMEQLVHLRLKSIYKAFKQNSTSTSSSLPSSYHMNGKYSSHPLPSSRGGGGGSSSSGRHHPQRLNDEFDFGGPDDPDVLFQAVKLSEAAASSLYSNSHKNNVTNSNGGKLSSNNRSGTNAPLSVVDRATRFKEEKEKADAAAAALLAELDEEEEENVKSKNKKKKKKKSKQQQQQLSPNNDIQNNSSDNGGKPGGTESYVDVDDDGDDDGSSLECISNLVLAKGEYMDSKPAAKNNPNKIDRDNNTEQDDDDDVGERSDQLEKDLCRLVAAEDIEGLENLMEAIKGIPGRAALRKNAKKALKKLRLATEPPQATDGNAAIVTPNVSTNSVLLPQSTRSAVRVLTPEIPSVPSDPNGYLHIISHVHNKPASQCATPGSQHVNSAQSRSRSNLSANANGPLKSECMMHVRPLIVGWMIGKGGQRIRDLMEESGARIWIDQDSMGANDPRILYVSGGRKNVDIAVGLLQNLVLKYQPLPSPHARQPTTPHTEKAIASTAATGKGPSIPESSDAPPLPLKQKAGPSTTNTATARLPIDGRSKQILSCDPRFVPLLIGRRGWTIKNIQDSTGAKVDIDQTSTPRKITVSGLEDNVDKAVRMVQDVLSYPHSQLHGVIEDVANCNDNDLALPDDAEPAVEQEDADVGQVVSPIQSEPLIPMQAMEVATDIPTPLSVNATAIKVPGHSPPSSLIMTGDAKSTISASSSLSSTPEPVLPSGPHEQVPPVDLGATTLLSPQTRDLFTSSGGLQQGSFNHLTPQNPLPHPSMFQSQNGNSFFGSLDQNYQSIPSDNQQHALHSPMPLHPYSPNQLGRPTLLPDQSSAFFSVLGQPQMATQLPLVPTPTQNLFGMGPTGRQSHGNLNEGFRQNDPSTSGVGPGFWNGMDAPQPQPMHGNMNAMAHGGFELHAAAVDFLEHSQQVHGKPISSAGDMKDVFGLSMPSPEGLEHALGSAQDPMLRFPKGRDDAQMIDSLFGPTLAAVPSSTAADNLLTTLKGLSLRTDNGSSGLWGNNDLLVNANNVGPREESTLFAGLASQKSESRFIWEESGQL